MALFIYYGNNIDNLADILAKNIKQNPLSSPFSKEYFIVQTKAIEKYLSLKIAKKNKIFSNFEFLGPATFFSDFLFGNEDFTGYKIERLTWVIYYLLKEDFLINNDSDFEKVKNYVANDDLKLFSLSKYLADVFDQYTIYRLKMITSWGKNKYFFNPEDREHEKWQMKLWQKIKDYNSDYKNKTYFLEGLKNIDVKSTKNIERLFLFSISFLHPYSIELFNRLAKQIDIYMFVLNPSPYYWLEMVSAKEKKQRGLFDEIENDYDNDLLANLGKSGRDFLSILYGYNFNENEYFEKNEDNNLLNNIKNDIYDGTKREIPLDIDEKDDSIVINSTYSILREIQVLKNYILRLFEKKPDLEPADILIMVPNLEDYSAYIDAVFSYNEYDKNEKYIPYIISDRAVDGNSGFIDIFLGLLDILDSSFEIKKVMSLFEKDEVLSNFNMDLNGFNTLKEIIKTTNIIRHKGDNAKDYLNSCLFGFDRLMSGYAMIDFDSAKQGFGINLDSLLFDDIYPNSTTDGSYQIIGDFLDYIRILFEYSDRIKGEKTIEDWSDLLFSAVSKIIKNSDLNSAILLNSIDELKKNMVSTILKVDFKVIKNYFKTISSQSNSSGYFMGSVSFCSFSSLTTIPFKVIALLGMNDGIFPKTEFKMDFNLLNVKPMKGDRNVKSSDRYLFLETLISAKENLYLSYIGHNIKDSSVVLPSVLISELIDYIAKNYNFPSEIGIVDFDKRKENVEKYITIEHPLYSFSSKYFKKDSKIFNYNKKDYQIALADYNKKEQLEYNFFFQKIGIRDDNNLIDLQKIISFYKNPASFFMKNVLKAQIPTEKDAFADYEPFEIGGLENYSFMNDYISCVLNNGDTSNLIKKNKSKGLFPHFTVGDVSIKNSFDKYADFINNVKNKISGREQEKVIFDFEENGFIFTGTMLNIYSIDDEHKELVFYSPSKLKAKHYLQAWISHLFLSVNSDFELKNTTFIGSDKIISFMHIDRVSAKELFMDLYKIFDKANFELLAYFPKTSFDFIERLQSKNPKPEDERLRSAIKGTWKKGYNGINGEENEDHFYEFLFHNPLEDHQIAEEFMRLSEEIFLPMFKFMN